MSAAATTATDLAVNEATAQVNGVAAEPGFKVCPFSSCATVILLLFLTNPFFQVFAGNLTYQTDEAALKNFFQEFSADMYVSQPTHPSFASLTPAR